MHPKTYVFDLDGVIYSGDDPQPHASETLAELSRRGRKIFFFTNNATKSREDYLIKLENMGIPVKIDEIMTSAYATALYLRESGNLRRTAYVVGEVGLVHELESAGIDIASNGYSTDQIDFVIVGLDRCFNYEKLTRAQQAILAGAKFIATNTDATLPVEGGKVIPGGGSIVSAIHTASGVTPLVIGKPETYALEKILGIAGSSPKESVMVGDRIETDIYVAKRLGMRSALILTGISDEAAVAAAPPEMKPERVIHALTELLDESWSDE